MASVLDNINRNELSAEHAEVIRATLPLVGKNIESITKLFYKAMFEKHPELLANKFNRSNQNQGAQQRALAASIATFAALLVDHSAPVPKKFFGRIGHKHAALGVTEEEYQIVHDNLFYAIVQVLGADVVTPDVAAAWDSVYWILARTLINLEKGLYASVGAEGGKVFREVNVIDRKDVADVAIITVEGDASATLPRHLPGQYVSVRAKLPDGAGQLRQYSLLDSGDSAGRYTFAVKRVHRGPGTEGEVSNWVGDNVKPGNKLEISLPFGELVLDVNDASPVVLVSAGIGETPMIGILSSLVATKSQRTVLCLHADANNETDALKSDRDALLAQLPNAKVEVYYTEGENSQRLDISQVELPDNAVYYICGGDKFLGSVRQGLDARGVPPQRVNYELFSPNDWLIDY